MTDREGGGLRLIYGIFLGLMLTTLIGVGINTFHPSPATTSEQLRTQNRLLAAFENDHPPAVRTDAERDSLRVMRDRIARLQDQSQVAGRLWMRSTSIILIACATLLMTLSMWGAEDLPVLGNGLLLGGVFTMIGGVGFTVASTESITRFVVLVVTLAITLSLGWWRFVRRQARAIAPDTSIPHQAGIAPLERRVAALEERLQAVAQLLARKE